MYFVLGGWEFKTNNHVYASNKFYSINIILILIIDKTSIKYLMLIFGCRRSYESAGCVDKLNTAC